MGIVSRVLDFGGFQRREIVESHRWYCLNGQFISLGSRWRCPYCGGHQTSIACADWANAKALAREENQKSEAWPKLAVHQRRNENTEE